MNQKDFLKKKKATVISQEQMEAMIQGDLKKGVPVMQISKNGEILELHLNSKIFTNK